MASAQNLGSAGATGADQTDDQGDTAPADLGSVNDLFAQLHPVSWKGVFFPLTDWEDTVRQDLVIHRYADRNGAFVEGTGRHPLQITAVIPFLNYISPATSEGWSGGSLYPFTFRKFINACLDGTSGTLFHPEFGPLNCKLDMAKTSWSGKVRGGVWCHATWVESDDDQADQLGQDLSDASPITLLDTASFDLDAQVAGLQSTLASNPFPPLQYSFSQLGGQIAAVIDTPTLLSKEFQGAADNVIYQCNQVKGALEMAANASPLNWPIFQNCERLKAVANSVLARPTVTGRRPTKILVTQKDSTLAQLIAQTGSTANDFLQLNYALVGQPVVPKGTQVLYYQSAA